MTKRILLFLIISLPIWGSAQVAAANDYTLNLNNADALITDGGVFFRDETTGSSGFAIPSGSQLHTFSSMAFWYGGIDVNGQLKLSAQQYDNFADQWTGPLTVGYGQTTPSIVWAYQNLFSITKAEIIDFQNNFMNPGYVVPNSISNWPAHGEVSLGYDYYLAPFVDVNGDGVYNPHQDGDYPCIRGDHAVYLIMNDGAYLHASGGDPIGLEMHYMFYEYNEPSNQKANTIFVHGKLINRGAQTLQNFKASVFLDGDIGNYDDDYFGSDSTRSLMYFYNGDNLDESNAVSSGYGENPPAAGIMSLSQDFESIGLVDANVTTAAQHWNLMNGMDAAGVPWTNPSTSNITKYAFASDPMSATETDSEYAQANSPGERRGVATLNLGTFLPAQEYEFDLAVIYNRNIADNIQNASELSLVADEIQDFADLSFENDCIENQNTIGVEELTTGDFLIYPNPSEGKFTISLNTEFSNAQMQITDLSGRNVLKRMELLSQKTLVEFNHPSGIYLLKIFIDGKKKIKRLVLK